MRVNLNFLRDGLAVAAATSLVSAAGLEWSSPTSLFSPVAPIAGISVAALFLRGLSLWPWVLVGMMLGRMLASPEAPLGIVISIAVVHLLGYVAGATYLRRRSFDRALPTLLDVWKLLGAAAIVAAISATSPFIQLLSTSLSPIALPRIWVDVLGNFFGRFTGAVIVGAAILTFPVPTVPSRSFFASWKSWTCVIGTIVTTFLVFGPLNEGRSITWIVFPFLIASALVGGGHLISQALCVVMVGAVWGTTHQSGAFIGEANPFHTLQQFLSVVSITGLVLASVATERRSAQAIQQRGEDLRFLSETAAEFLSSSFVVPSIQKMLSGLAGRCDVDVVTYHTVSSDRPTGLMLAGSFGITGEPRASRELNELETTIRAKLGDLALSVEDRGSGVHTLERDARMLKASLCQPIVSDGELLGVISVGSAARASIEVGVPKLLETVAYYIATAVRRLRQEDELRESESRLRELANAVPHIVWVSDTDGAPDFYNERWYEFSGEAHSTGHLSPLLSLCEPSEREIFAGQWAHSLRSGERLEIEHRLKRHDGQYRWVLTRAVPVRAPNGVIVRWIGTSTDLHDKKMLETERAAWLESERAARSEAETANRVKDDFLATLSHELRNPLNAIVGWAHLLSREKVDAPRAARIIEQNARHQAQLIDDLLDMSRILSGKLSVTGGVVLFSDVVSGAVESMQLVAHEKGVEIATFIEPGIELASADSGRITQVVSNLLTNAIKFTPRGGRVTTTLTSSNQEAVLTVTDTGEGIAPEFLPHLFDRFRQADSSTTRRHGGLGIGLAIARHLTALHGGRISATSAGRGQGATFTVVIPLQCRQQDIPMKCAEVSPTVTGAPQGTLSGSRIVIVEDDPAALEFLSRWLSDKGASVVTCSDGASAIDAVRSQRPDLIMSDVGMPGMDGYKLASHLRQIAGGDLPIIAITGFARPEDEARALSAGFDAHLAKPIDLDTLEQTVVHFLREPTRRVV